ncbi:MAG: porin [Pirellulales bacterium]|nr:porin [Pirellulales bacterium]
MKTVSMLVIVLLFGGLCVPGESAEELQQPYGILQEVLAPSADAQAALYETSTAAEDVEAELVGYSVLRDGPRPYCMDCYSDQRCCSKCYRRSGLDFGGWIDQGFTANASNPADRYNGVMGMNDRANQYQMNQLWLYLEKETAVRGCGWDIGGRIDAMFGTDAYFIECADGLEADWNQTDMYQMALPQFYLDIAYNDFTFTLGHFISPLEWESYMAPNNFFYSHSYAFMYGVPGTFTGGLLTWDFSDQAQVFVGFHRGSDQFSDTDGLDAMNFLCGASWMSEDEGTYLEFGLTAEEYGHNDRVTIGAISVSQALTCRLNWMGEYTWGNRESCGNKWYGINQHLIYCINPCWAIGGRLEWFRDDDGGQIEAWRPGSLCQGPYIGNFWDLTLGINWTPNNKFIVRNEVRWDWYDADHPGGPEPFDAGDKNDQFTYAIDLIYLF